MRSDPMTSGLISTAAAVVLGFGVMVAGCADRSQMSRNDQRPRVLTTFTVLADLARNVAGDRLQVTSQTSHNGSLCSVSGYVTHNWASQDPGHYGDITMP